MIPIVTRPVFGHKLLREMQAFPVFSLEDERELSHRWRDQNDATAANKIVTAHLRLVAKIAAGYQGYGLPVDDLVSEGSLGLMQALRRFDPDRGTRFATYAMWWIRAAIQEHILDFWSMVRLGTTAAQKKLFFNLHRLKSQMHILDEGELLPEQVASIARTLAVPEQDVIQMNRRLNAPPLNLTMPIRQDSDDEWQENLTDDSGSLDDAIANREELSRRMALLPGALSTLSARERHILTERHLKDEPTLLRELSDHYHISGERVRQIEMRAFEKLRKYVKARLNDGSQDRSCAGRAGHTPCVSNREPARAAACLPEATTW